MRDINKDNTITLAVKQLSNSQLILYIVKLNKGTKECLDKKAT
jgi:hypothetical protein